METLAVIADFASVALLGLLPLLYRFGQSYMDEKAKQFATKEDFEKILDQTHRLTTQTEQIKAQVSNETWDRQIRWTAKRDMYFRLLGILGETRKCLNDSRQGLKPHTVERLEQLMVELTQLSHIATIVISDDSLAALIRSGQLDQQIVWSAIRDEHKLMARISVFDNLIQALIAAARRDLGMEALQQSLAEAHQK